MFIRGLVEKFSLLIKWYDAERYYREGDAVDVIGRS